MEQLCKFLCGCFFDMKKEHLPRCDRALTPVEQTSYHVFLSHRGPDTKKTVVDVLRAFLESKGITCFVDYRMTEGSDFPPNLRQAIRNSKVHIVVLSPRFAESSWCLDEVADIMDLQWDQSPALASANYHVLPIFYGVKPEDVHHPLPGSAYDLSKLPKRYSTDQRFRWSNALCRLSLIVGFDWSNTATTFQGGMTATIQLKVEEFLSSSLRPSVYVSPHFQWESMYSSQMEQAEKALCSHASHVDDINVSIGIRGHHRSEFAKVLFNRFRKDFMGSCILLGVGEQAKLTEGLLKLQSTLLSELLINSSANPSQYIGNTDVGLATLLDRLNHTKCFIVMDDIDDNEEQLRSLLVLNRHQLGRGSRLVLTSRFSQVFNNKRVVDETIELRQCTGTEDTVEERRRRLAICCESKDVHLGFIDHLTETFSMLGLCVSVVSRASLLKVASDKQVSLIVVILSQSFNVDSPGVEGMLDEVASTCTDVKLVYVFYGRESGSNVWSGMDADVIASTTSANTSSALPLHPRQVNGQGARLRRCLSRSAYKCSVNFNAPSKTFDKAEHLINYIVKDHMRHDYKLSVTEFPVGLIKRQHEIEDLILSSIDEGKKQKCIGILGMGGIGKTTIAQSLYNKLHRKFEGSAFLLNVRAQAKATGLASLQKAIFDSVLGEDQVVNFSEMGQGCELLSKRLCGTHTLVILDHVDHASQLEALLSPLDLASGSVVIMTSRDRHILDTAEVDEVFEISLLDKEDARKLFYWHAFLEPFPPRGLRDIIHKVIDACDGLPLSLKVIGAHVSNHINDGQFWEETLDHLEKADHEIFKVLKLSVEALDESQREAFLDVCCFLVGKPYETAQRVWKACGWNGAMCMNVLKSKCLISVDPMAGTIRMQKQIRDMGRCMADQPSRRRHIWNAMDAMDIPHDTLACNHLRGFAWISQEEDMANCDVHAMQRLSHVKIFLLRNVQIVGEFPNLPFKEIRWLQWQNSPFQVLPPGLICSRKLCVLDLSGSTQLEALWRDLDPSCRKVPEGLRELNLSGCKNLTELPQFDRFLRDLEWFSLNGCERIDHLHNSIGSLTLLKSLDLSGCTSLRSLPDAIQDLPSLEKLLLSHCSLLDSLPQGFGRHCKLIEVWLDHTGLSTLPESLGKLKSLEKINLNGCPNLASLPLSIGGLEVLRVCNLSDCPKLQSLPERFCELTNLDYLNLSNCGLKDLPVRIGNLLKLRSLSLEKNLQMRRLPPSMGEMRSLLILSLGFCPLHDDGMPKELERLDSLEELDMRCTDLVEIPPSFAYLGNLSRLYLHHCAKLEQAAFFSSSLKFVDMGHCPRLQRVAGLEELKSLEHLVLCNCPQLRELSGLGGLDSLQSLDISGCESLYSSAVAYSCPQALRRLQLSGSHVLPSKHLLQLPSLEHITYFGTEMPVEFVNCLTTQMEAVENANELVMTIDISASVSSTMSRHSCFTIVICLVSHDQGWSQYDSKEEYGSYLECPTFMEAVLMRDGLRECAVKLLYRNRHCEIGDQVHLAILRRQGELLQHAEVRDKIEIRACSQYQGWRITIKQVSYIVLVDGVEELSALLQDI